MRSYVQIDISIFDPARDLRGEVFDAILPELKLAINRTPPHGVPLFAIVDPDTKAVVGESILGFSANDQSKHMAYLTAHAKH